MRELSLAVVTLRARRFRTKPKRLAALKERKKAAKI
jgi:hypothetical protein